MHLSRRDDFPSVSRNTAAPRAELRGPTPPTGGWSAWYLTDEDDMGESIEQGLIVRLLLAAVTELARERGWAHSLVASDQFFAWIEGEPLVRVSPDVYLLDDPPLPYPDSWQTWRPGHRPPRFALEVVSQRRRKDYEDAPPKYDQLGARELIVFDPGAVTQPRSGRMPLQVHRRTASGWMPVTSGPGPVHSAELDAWLVVVPGPRLRVARDPEGRDLVPVLEEQVSELRAENAALRAENAALRAENAELRAENAVLRAENAELRETVKTLEAKVISLETTITGLETTITGLEATITGLEAKIASLEALVNRLLA